MSAILNDAQGRLADQIDAVLPQTQCKQCEYPDCRRYAEAMAVGEAAINQCPPGGEEGIAKLARITGHPIIPLNPAHGVTQPFALAVIDEAVCIGCTLCIQACPVDAILGAAKQMHTVIASECTGCELCIAPCPVDCITMEPAVAPPPERADHWRARHRFHLFRVERDKRERAERLKAKALAKLDDPQFLAPDKQAKIQAALARAAARQAESAPALEPTVDPKALARQEKLREILARAAARRGPPAGETDHEDE